MLFYNNFTMYLLIADLPSWIRSRFTPDIGRNKTQGSQGQVTWRNAFPLFNFSTLDPKTCKTPDGMGSILTKTGISCHYWYSVSVRLLWSAEGQKNWAVGQKLSCRTRCPESLSKPGAMLGAGVPSSSCCISEFLFLLNSNAAFLLQCWSPSTLL